MYCKLRKVSTSCFIPQKVPSWQEVHALNIQTLVLCLMPSRQYVLHNIMNRICMVHKQGLSQNTLKDEHKSGQKVHGNVAGVQAGSS